MNFTKLILSLNLRTLHFNIVEPKLDFDPIFAINPPLLFPDPSVSILTSSDRSNLEVLRETDSSPSDFNSGDPDLK